MTMSTTVQVIDDTCDTAAAFSVLAWRLAYLAQRRAAEARATDQADADRWLLILTGLNAITTAVDATLDDDDDRDFEQDDDDHDHPDNSDDYHEDSPSLDDHPWTVFQRGERE
jgi:hypothetical protein